MGAGRRLSQIGAYAVIDMPSCAKQPYLSAVRENHVNYAH